MKRGARKVWFALCLLFAAVLVFSTSLSSAALVGISPATHKYANVLRGGYAERVFTITIDSEEPVNVYFSARGEIAKWLNFTQNVSVSKSKPARVVVSVSPPPDVPNGIYTGFFTASTSPLGTIAGENKAVATARAVLDVVLSVEITDVERMACAALDFGIHSVEKGDDAILDFKLKNEGNIRINPEVKVDIWNQEQSEIVKSLSFHTPIVLPTKTEEVSFPIETDELDFDQYWLEVSVPDCFAKTTLTFDVLEPGTLRADGILKGILVRPVMNLGETATILVQFQNTGEKEVVAQFKGQISREGKIVYPYESEQLRVPVGQLANFTFFYTPKQAGKYVVSGRVFYDKKRTFESSRTFEVVGKPSRINVLLYALYALLIIFILVLLYKIRKERKRYLEKLRGLR
ncbi:hypothetical protein D6817_00545 [Candidatus Pacearchaeota archaeon]|nr:MAG: hypothetical protein D6817_00545 [Candidatus Pacearchaeota archaeon]